LDESFGKTSKAKEEVDESQKNDLACRNDKERFDRAGIAAEAAYTPSGGFDTQRGLVG
jgi:hypothetical protein